MFFRLLRLLPCAVLFILLSHHPVPPDGIDDFFFLDFSRLLALDIRGCTVGWGLSPCRRGGTGPSLGPAILSGLALLLDCTVVSWFYPGLLNFEIIVPNDDLARAWAFVFSQ